MEGGQQVVKPKKHGDLAGTEAGAEIPVIRPLPVNTGALATSGAQSGAPSAPPWPGGRGGMDVAPV